MIPLHKMHLKNFGHIDFGLLQSDPKCTIFTWMKFQFDDFFSKTSLGFFHQD